jgi:hypothetical protein
MFRRDTKKRSLLLATVMLAKLTSAQGLPWLDEPSTQTGLVQNASPNQTPLLQTMAPVFIALFREEVYSYRKAIIGSTFDARCAGI